MFLSEVIDNPPSPGAKRAPSAHATISAHRRAAPLRLECAQCQVNTSAGYENGLVVPLRGAWPY